MNTLSRVEQQKNCDYVGWQTYGKEMSWGGGNVGQCKEAELQCYGFVDRCKILGSGTLNS
jgi:hypothetical protein